MLEDYCSFPALEEPKLARRLLFCFLTRNEDMHLKNFSLRVDNGVVSLAPAYDLLNTTLVLEDAVEETALPLAGKKKKLTRKLWIDFFCRERLSLSEATVRDLLNNLGGAVPRWRQLLSNCYLSPKKRSAYLDLLEERIERLNLALP